MFIDGINQSPKHSTMPSIIHSVSLCDIAIVAGMLLVALFLKHVEELRAIRCVSYGM